ncbi:MAG: YlmC/YmxH family sporulation protein [Bacilli bacterium]
MKLSDLQTKDIVSLTNGKKIGNIIDVIIDDKGTMKSLIVQRSNFIKNIFNKDEFEIHWNEIEKIGEDVILVKIST